MKTLEERGAIEQALLAMDDAAFILLRSDYRMRAHRAELVRTHAEFEVEDANRMLRIMQEVADHKQRVAKVQP